MFQSLNFVIMLIVILEFKLDFDRSYTLDKAIAYIMHSPCLKQKRLGLICLLHMREKLTRSHGMGYYITLWVVTKNVDRY